MTHTTDTIALVEISEGAKNHQVINNPAGLSNIALRWNDWDWEYKELPPGTWKLIGLSTEMTEEKAREAVLAWAEGLQMVDVALMDIQLMTALAMWEKIKPALGCDPAKTYAVLINDKK